MKKILCLAAGMLALNLMPGFGQPSPTPMPIPPGFPALPSLGHGQLSPEAQVIMVEANRLKTANGEQTPALARFNLDFPGGTPGELVKAIEKATLKPLNVIIPDDDASAQLPPLKMNDVDVAQLFQALAPASVHQTTIDIGRNFINGQPRYSTFNGSYGFSTSEPGAPTDSSIWCFLVTKPALPPTVPPVKACQFYSLQPYLDRGFTVDDITTAIQTGWKMAGVSPAPELNYHKETRLLIAYGEPDKLKTISNVLATLPTSNMSLPDGIEFEKGLQKTQKQIGDLNAKINKLEQEIDRLASDTNAVPAEKSGK